MNEAELSGTKEICNCNETEKITLENKNENEKLIVKLFYSQLEKFLKDIISIYPETETPIVDFLDYLDNLKHNPGLDVDDNPKLQFIHNFALFFIEKNNLELLLNKSDSLLLNNNFLPFYFLKLNFLNLYKKSSFKNRRNILNYIHSLLNISNKLFVIKDFTNEKKKYTPMVDYFKNNTAHIFNINENSNLYELFIDIIDMISDDFIDLNIDSYDVNNIKDIDKNFIIQTFMYFNNKGPQPLITNNIEQFIHNILKNTNKLDIKKYNMKKIMNELINKAKDKEIQKKIGLEDPKFIKIIDDINLDKLSELNNVNDLDSLIKDSNLNLDTNMINMFINFNSENSEEKLPELDTLHDFIKKNKKKTKKRK